jgi:hypothetical protein
MIPAEMIRAMFEELQKIAGLPLPSIQSVPNPGAQINRLAPRQPSPVSPSTAKSKLVSTARTAPKTNYTSVGNKPPTPNVSLTVGQQNLPPPVVR